MQSLVAALVLASHLPVFAGAGRGATPLRSGAITSEPAPPGEPFAADYEDDVMGGAPVVDSIVKTWAGGECLEALLHHDPTVRRCGCLHCSEVGRSWLCCHLEEVLGSRTICSPHRVYISRTQGPNSVTAICAGSKGSSAFEQLDAQGPAVLAALQREWTAADVNASAGTVQEARAALCSSDHISS